jgi:hypothetical protein
LGPIIDFEVTTDKKSGVTQIITIGPSLKEEFWSYSSHGKQIPYIHLPTTGRLCVLRGCAKAVTSPLFALSFPLFRMFSFPSYNVIAFVSDSQTFFGRISRKQNQVKYSFLIHLINFSFLFIFLIILLNNFIK